MTIDAHRPKPVILCILDGFGHRAAGPDNAITLAHTPTLDRLAATCPQALLATSGEAVGLPDGQMGNSEVGHMNIGAGRIATQDLPRIDMAIAKGEFARNPKLTAFLDKVRAGSGRLHIPGLLSRAEVHCGVLRGSGRLHIPGLLSPGGVHSHQDHIVALARAASDAGCDALVHAFLDGRDTPPQSADAYLAEFEAALASIPRARIATIGGRYYAMDRDQRWERVKAAYDVMVHGAGARVSSARDAVAQAYATGKTDEFVLPVGIGAYDGMRAGDGLIMANFRADRARQILTALVDPAFSGFDVGGRVAFSAQMGMVEYSTALSAFIPALFPAVEFSDTLGEVVSRAGLAQLRLAETEKFAHVTYFLNGGAEAVFPGEDRILVQSPKVATYDLKPDMSAGEVTNRLVEAINADRYDLIVVNYANGDMVGHTGDLPAAISAVETLDQSLGRVLSALTPRGGAMLITADHGNAEMMRDPATGAPHTAHTVFDVPVILAGAVPAGATLRNGRLADVAPTVLDLMGLVRPMAMTGRSLLGDEPHRG